MYRITNQGAADAVEIDALLDLAFGPDRLAKTSYRYRRGVAEAVALGLVARDGGRVLPFEILPDRPVSPLPASLTERFDPADWVGVDGRKAEVVWLRR